MRKQSWTLLLLMSSGCVFTDLKEIPQQIGVVPGQDVGVDQSLDIGPVDMGTDFESPPDMAIDTGVDVGLDAEFDLPRVCWEGFRDAIPDGGTFCSGSVEPAPPCDAVTQMGCSANRYCGFAFNGTDVVPKCLGFVPFCEIALVGEVCATDLTTKSCEPGAFCPSRFGAEQTTCRWICQLATGLGCDIGETCIANRENYLKNAGYGECETEVVCL